VTYTVLSFALRELFDGVGATIALAGHLLASPRLLHDALLELAVHTGTFALADAPYIVLVLEREGQHPRNEDHEKGDEKDEVG
jgi:hypothetical protein